MKQGDWNENWSTNF